MERKQIGSGAYITVLDSEKFNRCRITLHFQFPADRSEATAAAVLPLVLERGYAGCPDMTELSRRLARLYGADLAVDNAVNGGNRILTAEIVGIRDKFALEGENLTQEYLNIVLGVAFDPYLVNGVFDPEAVQIEKATLAQRLEAEINDKRGYCVRQARRKFYGSSKAGIERDGYLEELPGLDAAKLKEVYDHILRTATVDVMVQGADADLVEKAVLQRLSAIDRAPAALEPATLMPRQECVHYTETFADLVQAKLCMLFAAGETLNGEKLEVSRLAMALFGGSVTSRLFLNVREKQSLCYYCGSSAGVMGGVMMVDSGVEPKNAEKAEKAILYELDQLLHGPITDEELEDCRRGILSGMDGVEDTLSGVENWYYMQICRGEALCSPAESRRRLQAVTKEQVRQVLAGYSLSVSYLVTAKEDAQ